MGSTAVTGRAGCARRGRRPARPSPAGGDEGAHRGVVHLAAGLLHGGLALGALLARQEVGHGQAALEHAEAVRQGQARVLAHQLVHLVEALRLLGVQLAPHAALHLPLELALGDARRDALLCASAWICSGVGGGRGSGGGRRSPRRGAAHRAAPGPRPGGERGGEVGEGPGAGA